MELKMYSSQLVLCVIISFSAVSAQSRESCVGRCGGGYLRADPCHCDYNCMSFMECCPDYKSVCTTENSCKGRCHEGFIRGAACDCDPGCKDFGKCCPDYESSCMKPTPRQPSPRSSQTPDPDARDKPPEPTKKPKNEAPEDDIQRDEAMPEGAHKIPIDKKDPSVGGPSSLSSPKQSRKRSPRGPENKKNSKLMYPEGDTEDPTVESTSSLPSVKKTIKRSPKRPEKKRSRTLMYPEDDTEDPYEGKAPSQYHKKSPPNKNSKSPINSSPKKPRKKKRKIIVFYEDEPEDSTEKPSKDKKRPPKKNSKAPKKKKTGTVEESEEEIEESEENVSSSSFSSSSSSSSVKGTKTTKKLSRKNQKKNKPGHDKPDPDNPDTTDPKQRPEDKNNKPKKPKRKFKEGDDDPDDPESSPEDPNKRRPGGNDPEDLDNPPEDPNQSRPDVKDDKPNKPKTPNTREGAEDPEDTEKSPKGPNEKPRSPSDEKDGKPKDPKLKEPNQRRPGDKDPEDPEKPPEGLNKKPRSPNDEKDGKPKDPKNKEPNQRRPGDKDPEDPEEPSQDGSPTSTGDKVNKPKKTKTPTVKEVTEEDKETNEDNEDNTSSSSNVKNTKKRSPANTNKNPKKKIKPKGNTDEDSFRNPSPDKRKKKLITIVPNKKKKRVIYIDDEDDEDYEDSDDPSKPDKGKKMKKKPSIKKIIKKKKKNNSEEERQETVESEFSSSSQSSSSHSRSKTSKRRMTGKNKKNPKDKNKKKIPGEPEEPLKPPKRKKDKNFPPTSEPTFIYESSGDDGSGMPTTMAATTLTTQFTTTELQTTVRTSQTDATVNSSVKPQTGSTNATSYKTTPSTPNLLTTEKQPEKTSTTKNPNTQTLTSHKITPSTPNLVSTEEQPVKTSTTMSPHTQSLTSHKTTPSTPNILSTEQPVKNFTTMSPHTQSTTPKEGTTGQSMMTNTPVQQSKNNKYTTNFNDLVTSVIVTENIYEAGTEQSQHDGSTVEQLQVDTKDKHYPMNHSTYTEMSRTDSATNNEERTESDIGSTLSSGINSQVATVTISPSHYETTEDVNKETSKSPHPINENYIEGSPGRADPTLFLDLEQSNKLLSELVLRTTGNLDLTATTTILANTDNVGSQKRTTEDIMKTMEAITTYEQPNAPSMNNLLINTEATTLPEENLETNNSFKTMQYKEGTLLATVRPSADILFHMASEPTVIEEENREEIYPLTESPTVEKRLTKAANNLTFVTTIAEHLLGSDSIAVDPTKQMLVSTVGESVNTSHTILSTNLNSESLPIHYGVTTDISANISMWTRLIPSMISTEINENNGLSTMATTEQSQDLLSLKTETPHIEDKATTPDTLDTSQTFPTHSPTFVESLNVNEKTTQLLGVTSPETTKEQSSTTNAYINRNNTMPLTDINSFTAFTESRNPKEATADTNTTSILTAVTTVQTRATNDAIHITLTERDHSALVTIKEQHITSDTLFIQTSEKQNTDQPIGANSVNGFDSVPITYTLTANTAPTQFTTIPDMVTTNNERQSSSESETSSLSGTVNILGTLHITAHTILLPNTDHIVTSSSTNTNAIQSVIVGELSSTVPNEVTDNKDHNLVTHISKISTEAQKEVNTFTEDRETNISHLDSIVTEETLTEHLFSFTTGITSPGAEKSTNQLQTSSLIGSQEPTIISTSSTLPSSSNNTPFSSDYKTSSSLVTEKANNTSQILEDDTTSIIAKTEILPTQNAVSLTNSNTEVRKTTESPEGQTTQTTIREYVSSSKTLHNITPEQITERESTEETQTTSNMKTLTALTEGQLPTVAPSDTTKQDKSSTVYVYHYTDITLNDQSSAYTFVSGGKTNTDNNSSTTGENLEELISVNEILSTQKSEISPDYTHSPEAHITSNITQTNPFTGSNTVQSIDDLQTTFSTKVKEVELATVTKDEGMGTHVTALVTVSSNPIPSTEHTIHTSKRTTETKSISNVTVTADVSPRFAVSVSETFNEEQTQGTEETSHAPKDQTLSVTLKTENVSGSIVPHATPSHIIEQQHPGHLHSTSLPYITSDQQLSSVTAKSPNSSISDTNSGATTTLTAESSSVIDTVVTESIDSKQFVSAITANIEQTISIQTVRDSTTVSLVGMTDDKFTITATDTEKPLEVTTSQRADLLPTDLLPTVEDEDLMSTEVLHRNNTLTTKSPGIGATSSTTSAAQHADQSIGTSSNNIYSATTTTENTGVEEITNVTVTDKAIVNDIIYQTAGLTTTENTHKTITQPTVITDSNIEYTAEIQDITVLPSTVPTEKELATSAGGTEYKTAPLTTGILTNSMSSLSSIPPKTPETDDEFSTVTVTEADSHGTDFTTQWLETTHQLSREQFNRTVFPTDVRGEQLKTIAITSTISTVAASTVSPMYSFVSNGELSLINDETDKVAVSGGQMSTINDVPSASSTVYNSVNEKTVTSIEKASPVSRISISEISREQLTGTSSMLMSLTTRQNITVQPTFVPSDAIRERETSTIVAKKVIVTSANANGSVTTVLDTESSTDQSSTVTNAEGSSTIKTDETKPLTTQSTSQGVRFTTLDMRPGSTEVNMQKSTVVPTRNGTPSSTAFKLLDKQLPTGKNAHFSSAITLSIPHTTSAQYLHTGKLNTENAQVTSISSEGAFITTKGNVLSILLGTETSGKSTTVSKNASGPISSTTLHRTVSPKYIPTTHTTIRIHEIGSSTQSLGNMNNAEQKVTTSVSTMSLIKSSLTDTKHMRDMVTNTTYNLHSPSFNFTVSTLKTSKDQSTTGSSDIIPTTISETLQETTKMSVNSMPVDPTKQTPPEDNNAKFTTSKQTSSAEYSTTAKSGHSTTSANNMVFSTTTTPGKTLAPFQNKTLEPTKEVITERDVTVATETTMRQSVHTVSTENPEENLELSSPAQSTVRQEQRPTPTKSTIYDITTKHVFNVNTKTPASSMQSTKPASPTGVPTVRKIIAEEMGNNINTTTLENPFHVCDLLKDEGTKLRISDSDLQSITEICMEMQQQQHPTVSTPAPETRKPNVNEENNPPRYMYVTPGNFYQQLAIRIIQIVEEIYRRMSIPTVRNITGESDQDTYKPTAWLLLLNKIKSSYDPEKNLCIGKPADGMTTLQNGSMVVFRGNYFWMVNQGGVTESPRKISEVWGIPSPIDTVFTRCNCGAKTFFFKGPQYWRFTNDIMDQGYPKEIVKGFGGFRGKVTAVLPVAGLNTRPESVYFFKIGGKVQKYTFRQEQSKKCIKKKRPVTEYPIYSKRIQTVQYRFPRHAVRHRIVIHRTFSNVQQQPLGILHEETTVRSTWRGVPNNIISAVSLANPEKQDGFDYFVFTKEKYYNINMSSKVAVKPPESEQKTSKDWYKCKE